MPKVGRLTRDALVVGIDRYDGNPLFGCVRDAREIAECLTLEQYDFNVIELLDGGASRASILQTLGSLIYSEGPVRDMLVFYFAGHGQVLGTSGYLVTADGSDYDPGVSFTQLSDLMESASRRYRHVVAILDCCHSGASGLPHSNSITADAFIRDIQVLNDNRVLLAACRAQEFAFETTDDLGARGAFTSVLVGGLLGDAVDFDGNVTALSLFEYVSRAMDQTRQTPVFKGDMVGSVELGSGFSPRVGRPLEPETLASQLSKAEALVQNYHSLHIRETSDLERRRQTGLRTCSLELAEVVRWFEQTSISLPDLERDSNWANLKNRVQNYQSALSNLTIGDQTVNGVVTRRIGVGGFGSVWQIQNNGEDPLAYKVFHGNELGERVKQQRFRNGYHSMRKLTHPNVVKVRDITEAPLGFTMELIDGSDLRNMYFGDRTPEERIGFLADVADVVRYAHGQGVIHRDIKPENVIARWRPDLDFWEPVLTDFDLAYVETNRTVTINLVGGAVNYAAPEQFFSPKNDVARAPTVDVYALAQLCYFVLLGQDPSPDNPTRNVSELRRVVSEWTSPEACDTILDVYSRSISVDPAARPATVGVVWEALVAIRGLLLEYGAEASLTASDVLRRVAHGMGGQGRYYFTDDGVVSFRSLSGRVELQIKELGVATDSHFSLRANLEIVDAYGVPGASSGATGRQALNQKLDRKLARFGDRVQRRNGTKGFFSTQLDISMVSLRAEGVSGAISVLSDAIAAIEEW